MDKGGRVYYKHRDDQGLWAVAFKVRSKQGWASRDIYAGLDRGEAQAMLNTLDKAGWKVE